MTMPFVGIRTPRGPFNQLQKAGASHSMRGTRQRVTIGNIAAPIILQKCELAVGRPTDCHAPIERRDPLHVTVAIVIEDGALLTTI